MYVLNYEKQDVLVKALEKGAYGVKEEIFSKMESINILGFDEEVEYELTDKGLRLHTKNVKTNMPVAFKIKLK